MYVTWHLHCIELHGRLSISLWTLLKATVNFSVLGANFRYLAFKYKIKPNYSYKDWEHKIR